MRTIATLLTTAAAVATFAAAAHADRVVTLPTGSGTLDGHCREYAQWINKAFADGNDRLARDILMQARMKGCRYLVLPVAANAGPLVLTVRAA
jgi:hypothetical protein